MSHDGIILTLTSDKRLIVVNKVSGWSQIQQLPFSAYSFATVLATVLAAVFAAVCAAVCAALFAGSTAVGP